MQSELLTYKQVREAIRTTLQNEGILSLWRGLSPTLLRDVPFSGKFTLVDLEPLILGLSGRYLPLGLLLSFHINIQETGQKSVWVSRNDHHYNTMCRVQQPGHYPEGRCSQDQGHSSDVK